MLCVMEGSQDGQPDATSEFIATGRTGRRNAMPDILSSHAATSTGDLPEALAKLSCSGNITQHFPVAASGRFRSQIRDSGGTSGAVGGGATGGGSGGAEGGQDQPSGS
ncbi:uncharacterized protein [Macrobrachium rosenbergii]|uniref:uncharacterized protein isoform X1 n=1 Tax=Macrobrachium rosenbergii TaxID=79674 RepID=UPI0034D6A50C